MNRGKRKDSWNNNKARNPYSLRPWKDVRKDKVINCPTNDPIIDLLGAILQGGYQQEGANYFSGICKSCSDGYNRYYCGSYWTDVAGVDHTYIRRTAKYGGTKSFKYHTV